MGKKYDLICCLELFVDYFLLFLPAELWELNSAFSVHKI